MTHRVGTFFLVLLLTAGCDESPPEGEDAGPTPDATPGADAGPGDDAGPSLDAGPMEDAAVPDEARFAIRDCDYTLSYAPPVGSSRVRVAGEFTDWETGALDLRDDDGDGAFELTLSPSARRQPGQLYAYKLIVDDRWVLDPGATHRKFADGCMNSGLLMPACDAGPEIVPGHLHTEGDAGAGRGRASVRVEIRVATDEARPDTILFTLDGAPLPAGAAVLDSEAGAYDVELTDLEAGRYTLSIRARDVEGRDAEPIDLPFWIEAEAFSWEDALMYMIVVDRFANGEPANDDPVGSPVRYPADFHGGDLQGATAAIEDGYFDRLGVNVLWLSPINQQADGHFEGRDDDERYVGYHGYWPSRGREVEPRFGGNDALRDFVRAAHRRGIRVLLDLINNQVHEQHEYYLSNPEWFRTGCVCGVDPGCGWSERPLDCLFAPYLPDIDWTVPGAERQFLDDAIYWVAEYDVDGYRIDAVKHVETNSIYNLRAELTRRFEGGGARIFLTGETAVGANESVDFGCDETYPDGFAWIDAYVGETALDSQFDFPTHHALQHGLVRDQMGYGAVEDTVTTFETRYRPEGLHVRFLGTHDSDRMASRADEHPAQGCRWEGEGACADMPSIPTDPATYGRLRRAFTVLYTIPGIPFLYYGDEVAMAGGNDPDNRRDMIFTDSLASLAMSGSELSGEQSAFRAFMEELGQARLASRAIRRGRRVPMRVTDNLYVYAYADDDPNELALVAVNRGAAIDGERIDGLTAGLRGALTTFEVASGSGAAVIEGSRVRITLPAGGAAIFLGRP